MTTTHDDADAGRLEEVVAAAIPGVVVQRFTATPEAVVAGGATTVAWKVTVPDSNDIIELKLNGELITSFGQKQFTNLMQSTDFLLSAANAHEEVLLRRLRVRVDVPDCIWAPPLEAFPIQEKLEFSFNQRFSGNSQFTLRDPKTVATLGSGTIDIAVPLTIHVDSWFDADMDIAIKLSVTGGAGSPVLVLSRGAPHRREHAPASRAGPCPGRVDPASRLPSNADTALDIRYGERPRFELDVLAGRR